VAEYVVVCIGLTVIELVFCPVFHAITPPAGEVVATKVVDCPVQIVAGFIAMVGVGARVVVMVAVSVHP
jgi:hypothetical protein